MKHGACKRVIGVAALGLMIAVTGAMAGQAGQASPDEVDGPFVRVMINEDGSRTVFRRSPDNRTLTKRTYSTNGVLRLITIYRMDRQGNPLSCKIYDGRNHELFKVRYGYDRTWGRLVEEQMFDSRVRHNNPDTGEEMPVRRFLYTYNAQGERSKPISIVLKPGARAEVLYAAAPSALDRNPFAEDEEDGPANPRARRLGRPR